MSQTKAQLLGPVLGDVNYDSGTLFVDSTNNRVGIGTTVPSNLLSIADNSSIAVGKTWGIDFRDSAKGAPQAFIYAYGRYDTNYNTDLIFGTTTTSGSAVERLRIIDSGNVGIGTTNPVSKLQVEGNILTQLLNGSPYIISRGAYSDNTTYTFYNNDTTGFTNPSAGIIGIKNSGSYTLTFNSNNCVGIGITNPQYKLDILGGDTDVVRFRGTSSGVRFQSNSTTMDIVSHNGSDTNTRNLIIRQYGASTGILLDTNGNVGIGTTNPVAQFHIGGTASNNNPWGVFDIEDGYFKRFHFSEGRGAYGLTGYGGYIGYNASDNNLTMGVYDNSAEYRIFNIRRENGNVGIRTTNPAFPLEVVGGNNGVITAKVLNGQYGAISVISEEGKQLDLGYARNTSNYGAQTTAGDFSIKTTAPRLHFPVGPDNANSVMVLKSDGNAGIGTTNPQYKLDVNGTFGFTSNENSPIDKFIINKPGDAARYWTVFQQGSSLYRFGMGSAPYNLELWYGVNATQSSPGSQLLTISPTGTVVMESTPYTSDSVSQTHTRFISYQNIQGFNQTSWYYLQVGSGSDSRAGSIRLRVNWTTRHASGVGYHESHIIWRNRHDNSKCEIMEFGRLRENYWGGSFYGWTSAPTVYIYNSDLTGSSAGIWIRIDGHISTNSGTYDGGVVHHIFIEHYGNKMVTTPTFAWNSNSTPGNVGTQVTATQL